MVDEQHRYMERSRAARPLVWWAFAGLLLTAVIVTAGLLRGGNFALALGGIVATLFAGTFPFVKLASGKRDETDGASGNAPERSGAAGMQVPPKETSNGKPAAFRLETASPLLQPGQGGNPAWHPALNDIEDVLVAQISDPDEILTVADRVGLKRGNLARGNGSAASLWHEVLRRAWIKNRAGAICQVLAEARKLQASDELSHFIAMHCAGQR